LGSLSEAWLAEIAPTVTKQTVSQQGVALRELFEFVGRNATVTAFERRIAGRFITERLLPSGRSRKTSNRLISSLSAFWTWLVCRSLDLVGQKRDWRGDRPGRGAVRWSAAPRPGDGRDRHDGERAVVIRAEVGLLELAKQLGNVSRACKVLGCSRDSFYRFRDLYEKGGELALHEITKSKPNLKNRAAPEVEEAVVQLGIDEPAPPRSPCMGFSVSRHPCQHGLRRKGFFSCS
jgi:hypothetical protein